MKKLIAVFLIILCFPAAAAAEGITVFLNGAQMSFEQEPILVNDSTLVPFRAIFEELNMTVQWFGNEKRVTAEKEGTSITLYIDNPRMYVNNTAVELNTPPIIYNDYTLVPLRAVSEAAGADVGWDGKTQTVTITTQGNDFDEWKKQTLEFTNAERAKYNLKPLKWDNSLELLADIHCMDMIRRGFFDHNNPSGETPFDRMKSAGISYLAAGENIAAGQYSPEAAVKSWMNSEGHRKNILNENFEYVGISVKRGGEYGIYWAQEFALFR